MFLSQTVNWERIGFFSILFTLAGLVWVYPYILSVDGAAHAANAKIIADLLSGDCPVAQKLFMFNPQIVPNWTGHAIMAALIYGGMSAVIAEKVVFTLCLILTAIGFRFFIRAAKGEILLSWPALVLSLSEFLTGGTYNYLLGVCFCFLALGFYLIKCSRPNRLSFILPLMSLLVLMWFSHIVAFLFFGLFVAVNEIFLLNRADIKSFYAHIKSRAGIVAAFFPSVMLTLDYLLTPFFEPKISYADLIDRKLNFFYIIGMYDFLRDYATTSTFYFGLTITLSMTALFFIVQNLLKRSKLSDLAKIALICTVILWTMSFFTQIALKGGWLLDARLRMMGWFFAFATISQFNLRKSNALVFVYLSVLMSGMNAMDFARSNSQAEKLYHAISHDMPAIKDNSLVFTQDLPGTAVIRSAASFNSIRYYLSLDKQCTYDLNNYEAVVDSFPIRYKNDSVQRTIYEMPPYFKDKDVHLLAAVKMEDVSRRAFERKAGLPIDYIILLGSINRMTPPEKEVVENKRLYYMKHKDQFLHALKMDLLDGFETIHSFSHNGHQVLSVLKRSETDYK